MTTLYFNATPDDLLVSQEDAVEWFDLGGMTTTVIKRTNMFSELPDQEDLKVKARVIASQVAAHCHMRGVESCRVMVGGEPYFQKVLTEYLLEVGYEPVYGFVIRETEEIPASDEDGEPTVTVSLRHGGWITPYADMFPQHS